MPSVMSHDFAQLLSKLGVELPVALAVSGGPDSLALMNLVADWAVAMNGLSKVHVLTVDHGLRAESRFEAEQVHAWAKGIGLSHHILSCEAKPGTKNLQAWAREARYQLMIDWCAENKVSRLLTAHHRDDEVENFLIRLTRGSGVKGLSGTSPVRVLRHKGFQVSIIRPLLNLPKADLVATLIERDLAFFEDPSNSESRFKRGQIRELKDQLSVLGLSDDRALKTVKAMRRSEDALQHLDAIYRDKFGRIHDFGFYSINVKAICDAPEETALRFLSGALCEVSGNIYPPRSERLMSAFEKLKSDRIGGGMTLHGCHIKLDPGGSVLIYRERRESGSARIAVEGSLGRMWGWDRRFDIRWPSGLNDRVEDLVVDDLGRSGYLHIRAAEGIKDAVTAWPGGIYECLPAMWSGDQLLSVPALGWIDLSIADAFDPSDFQADFLAHSL